MKTTIVSPAVTNLIGNLFETIASDSYYWQCQGNYLVGLPAAANSLEAIINDLLSFNEGRKAFSAILKFAGYYTNPNLMSWIFNTFYQFKDTLTPDDRTLILHATLLGNWGPKGSYTKERLTGCLRVLYLNGFTLPPCLYDTVYKQLLPTIALDDVRKEYGMASDPRADEARAQYERGHEGNGWIWGY